MKFIDNEQSSSAKARNKNIMTNIFRIQAHDSIMYGYFCIGFINFMFNGNSLTDYTSIFSPNDFKIGNSNLALNDLTAEPTAEPSSLERSAKYVTKFRLDEINKIKDYLNSEIKERKDIIKKISKYIVAFDYADKLFITLSASFGTLSIASHATIVGIPVRIAGASLTLIFTVTTGVVKKLIKYHEKKEEKTK